MVGDTFELPAAWTKQSEETRRKTAIVEFTREADTGTRFIVSVSRPTDERSYQLQLSTITPHSTHVRHDYPIETYDSTEAAKEAAEEFTEHISQRLREGSISMTDPDIGAVQDAINAFTEPRSSLSLRRIIRRLR